MSYDPEPPSERTVPLDILNRLAVSIIHEVSNPLSIIIGNAQYILLSRGGTALRQVADEEEVTGTVQAILDESMRLAGLVSLLLGFCSRMALEGLSPATALAELERRLDRLKSNWATEIEFQHTAGEDAG